MRIPFRKILVAIDESEVSNKALTAAIAMAQALKAKLTITHVLNSHDVPSPAQPSWGLSPEAMYLDEHIRQQFEEAWRGYVNHSESLLKQKANAAIAAGVDTDFIQPYGSPGSVLCKVARTANIDLMIIGSHQRRGMTEIMLGSVSNYITHYAPCSVLVVYPDTATESERKAPATAVGQSVAAA